MAETLLEMKHIEKAFPGVKALNGVSFSVAKGEVHALMGENGAGKSTLIKILTGLYQMDSGEVVFDGQKVLFGSTLEAQKAGISTVYQELNMIPYLSASENIFLGRYPKNKAGIDWKRMHREAQKLICDMDLDLDAKAPLNTFGTATQQMISIVRAISFNCKLVVMDEPTSSLDMHETNVLLNLIGRLRDQGISIIFITHRLDEVYRISDKITILKDGGYVGTYLPSELTQYQLVAKMVGHDVEKVQRSARGKTFGDEQYLVELQKIVKEPKVKDVSFAIRKGEIVGLAGLLGSGRTETAQVLFGCERPDSGVIIVDGKQATLRAPTDALREKLAFCTENRREEGVLPNMSVRDNLAISIMPSICKLGFVNKKARAKIVQEYIKRFNIKTPSMDQKMKNLSGGNQQKVILARWLATNPKLIILDEPTRGIDVGAKREVEQLIEEFVGQGIGVLYISSELSELVRNCDRVVIMREGYVIGELSGDELNENTIMQTIADKQTAK